MEVRTDSSKLRKHLHRNPVHQPRSPLRDCEHDAPPGHSDRLLGSNRSFDLMELLLDPLAIAAVRMQLLQHAHRFFFPVGFHQVSRRFGEEHDAESKKEGRQSLEGERETPLEAGGVWRVRGAVAYPSRAACVSRETFRSRTEGRMGKMTTEQKEHAHNKSHPNHLLRQSNNQPPDLRMRTLALIYRHAHTQQPHRPTSENSSYEDHRQVHCRGLQDRPDEADERPDDNRLAPSEAVHGEPAHERAENGPAIESAVYGADDGRGDIGSEVLQEVFGLDHVGHHACVITEEEGSASVSLQKEGKACV